MDVSIQLERRRMGSHSFWRGMATPTKSVTRQCQALPRAPSRPMASLAF